VRAFSDGNISFPKAGSRGGVVDDLFLKGAREAARRSKFSVGFGLVGGASALVACERLEVDHYIGLFFAAGAFQISAAVGRKLDSWFRA